MALKFRLPWYLETPKVLQPEPVKCQLEKEMALLQGVTENLYATRSPEQATEIAVSILVSVANRRGALMHVVGKLNRTQDYRLANYAWFTIPAGSA